MELIVPREARFIRAADGSVWIGATSTYEFWQRYLDVFESVRVLARVREVESPPPGWLRSDGPGVTFTSLPPYSGPVQYLKVWNQYRAVIRRESRSKHAAFVLRAPGQSSTTLMNALPNGRPFGVEVVGDPWDVFAPGAIRHPARPILRSWMTRDLRKLAARASAVSYVTEEALQRRYPANAEAFTTHYSSIELNPNAFVEEPRNLARPLDSVRTILVGSLEQMYKGADILISAVAECKNRGLDITVRIVGSGRHQDELQSLASHLGVDRQVEFLGKLPSGDAVRHRLQEADLFVLPSRTEGLPRAMIEAMAQGLPCIGTRVGGIPELLPDEDLVSPDDPRALASKINEVVQDPARMQRMSARNLEKAQEYRSEVLRQRRIAFYSRVKESTLEWREKVSQ